MCINVILLDIFIAVTILPCWNSLSEINNPCFLFKCIFPQTSQKSKFQQYPIFNTGSDTGIPNTELLKFQLFDARTRSYKNQNILPTTNDIPKGKCTKYRT